MILCFNRKIVQDGSLRILSGRSAVIGYALGTFALTEEASRAGGCRDYACRHSRSRSKPGWYIGDGDPEPVSEVLELGLDNRAPTVAQDSVQAPRQDRIAEIEPLERQLGWPALGDKAVQDQSNLGPQEAAHAIDQRVVTLAGAGLGARCGSAQDAMPSCGKRPASGLSSPH